MPSNDHDAFLDNVPSNKLVEFIGREKGFEVEDDNFHLDLQNLSTPTDNQPRAYNLQVQGKREAKNKAIAKMMHKSKSGGSGKATITHSALMVECEGCDKRDVDIFADLLRDGFKQSKAMDGVRLYIRKDENVIRNGWKTEEEIEKERLEKLAAEKANAKAGSNKSLKR
ncbi:MAG: hypothetical protein M1812_005408 [Candelaria pacifica]|nr:MAG: hypothetical protein M1812_005408 [Candelaria pacifica]